MCLLWSLHNRTLFGMAMCFLTKHDLSIETWLRLYESVNLVVIGSSNDLEPEMDH